ncbi:hypothetical protein BP5796_02031 [Coleophoma crateriformis]|uniref:Pseudouridine-5'-phosphate glycosidase n=1 Tax=Coleophoma crateriformis TaxID=565419 RepID=A0A3D8T231_9HELO|nr:hypothetical protein BP5796_02031 [Coleophoma crateriformis]
MYLFRTGVESITGRRTVRSTVGHISISPARYRFYSTQKPRQKFDSKVFRVSEEVEDAVRTGKPVVALESTIYTHGYPPEQNGDLAVLLEDVLRENGVVPATIAVVDGAARVGLSTEELRRLASVAGKPEAMKVSRRDLPYIIGLGLAGRPFQGGTTISGSMVLAQMAGIEILGTGGLGGVHRGGQDTMDISADLTELGRTNITVISSGCKSFLDLSRTLEYLETQGVCVSTFADGRAENDIDIPSFYCRNSGIRSPTIVQDETEAAAIIYAQRQLGLSSGIFFANPIPASHSIPQSELEDVIDTAVQEAIEQGYHGASNTPFILAKIKERTGKVILANKAMMERNVTRAAKVSVELSRIAVKR